ncbi:hypothetical protein [Pseudomonas sp. MN1F]|uniref:hypothetical protein n=1 Tax=Pseudomonas sp. MN1F TaxID=1366632 RepID=UPI00128F748F|nr:hypothetical protein [Pseudomonas sp. MN1F]MQG92025.1 hypothetical protein [Pseudomonas sp. MN1F]
MNTIKIDQNSLLAFPIEVTLNVPLDVQACTKGGIRFCHEQGNYIPITLTIEDAENGRISIMPEGVIPAGKYSVVVSSAAISPENRLLEGDLILGYQCSRP